MTLTQEERQNPLWQKLKKHFETRIAELREQNDEHCEEARTVDRRARIQELKALLAMEEVQRPLAQVVNYETGAG